MLRIVDRTFASPGENLDFDDALLDARCETLRFWESPVYFVVLGRAGNPEREVDRKACRAAGIPVLRRSSGGGAVLLGPGSLNFALALSLERSPALQNVPASYHILLSQVASALRLPGLEVHGSDILLDGRKVSGSAQRRTRGWLLHHGSLLYGLDVRLMERFLPEPPRRPPHRGPRTHRQFLTALPLDAAEMKRRLAARLSSPRAGFQAGGLEALGPSETQCKDGCDDCVSIQG
jgi:lipoate-protein ligase A